MPSTDTRIVQMQFDNKDFEKNIALSAQGFNDGQYSNIDYRDIRFNQTKRYLYVTAMGWPDNQRVVVKSLAKGNQYLKRRISSVWLMGYGKVKASQTAEGLIITLPDNARKNIIPVFRINK